MMRHNGRWGLPVASLFTGAGGSCLGFREAGLRPVVATEFIPEAAEVYRRNFPGVPIVAEDVRDVTAADLLRAAGADEIAVVEGSPPCSSFSVAGRRARGWGRESRYSSTSQRTDDLVFEFARLVAEVGPRAFVMENVPGLASGPAKLVYFDRLMGRLRRSGYDVCARVLDAAALGVPQRRRRLIIAGLRADLVDDAAARSAATLFPRPSRETITIRDALAPLASDADEQEIADREAASFVGTAIYPEWVKLGEGGKSRYHQLTRPGWHDVCPTVTVTSGSRAAAGVTHPAEPRKFTPRELLALSGFPPDFDLGDGPFAERYERVARAVPPPVMRAVAEQIAAVLDAA